MKVGVYAYRRHFPPLPKFAGVRNVLLDPRMIFWRHIGDSALPRQLEP
jgi:hypothetical protein